MRVRGWLWRMGMVWVLAAGWSLTAAAADDREPTPEETAILEYLNRMRLNPQAEIDRIAPGGAISGWIGRGVDTAMFVSEMKALQAAPPLVFNLDLLAAARKHSAYCIANGQTHVEEAGKPGFVAAQFAERGKLAGYTGFPCAENVFIEAPDPWTSHCGFTVDTGAGPGGMQPSRGHRTNMMNPSAKEIGCSAVAHGKRIAVTHNFGIRQKRLAGGVVYFDRNGNGFYDIGEGAGGVTISASDGASAVTWKSGAFALDLKGAGPVVLTAEFAGQKFSREFAAGDGNVKFDWIVPEKAAIEKTLKLLAAVNAAGDPKSPAYFNAVVALYLGARGLGLPPELQKRFAELTGTAGAELESHQKAVLDEFAKIDAKMWRNVIAEHQKAYRSTAASRWFKDAELAGTAKLGFAEFDKRAAQMTVTERRAFTQHLEAMEKQLATPVFQQELAALAAEARALEKPAAKRK